MTAPAFSLRREAPFVLAAMAAALLVRWPAIELSPAYLSGDTAGGALMAKHVWTGEAFPIFYYGQSYIGMVDWLIAAPFYGLFGADPRGLGWAQALTFALSMLIFYPLLFRIGGRGGAVAGTLALAIGTPWFVLLTAGENWSYLSTLWLGALLYLVGLPFVERPSARRAILPGLVAGLGYYNNPQIAFFVAPLVVALWARGRTCTLRDAGELRRALSPAGVRWLLAGAVAASIAGILLACWLCWHGPTEIPVAGFTLSFGKPRRYLMRGVLALFASLVALEFWLAVNRRRWLAVAAAFGIAFAAGASPIAAGKLQARRAKQKSFPAAPMELDPTRVPQKVRGLLYYGGTLLLGNPVPTDRRAPPLQAAYPWLRRFAIAFAAVAALAFLGAFRTEWWRLVTLRPVALSALTIFALHGVVWTTLFLLHEGEDLRYCITLWVPLAGLVAWATRGLLLAHVALPAAVLLLLGAHHAFGLADAFTRFLPEHDWWDRGRLIPTLEERGAHHGYANYWVALPVSYLSDERVRVGVRGEDRRIPRYRREADRDPLPFTIFNPYPPYTYGEAHDVAAEAAFLAEHGDRVVERWRAGVYRVYRWRRD